MEYIHCPHDQKKVKDDEDQVAMSIEPEHHAWFYHEIGFENE